MARAYLKGVNESRDDVKGAMGGCLMLQGMVATIKTAKLHLQLPRLLPFHVTSYEPGTQIYMTLGGHGYAYTKSCKHNLTFYP